MPPPKLAKFFLKVLTSGKDRTYLGDVEEIYLNRAEGLGADAADRWYWREALRSLPKFFYESIRWRIIMFKNYLKTAIRHFFRDKGYSFLNMAGLALGLACFALIMMWVRDEIGWDRFHENFSLLYRLESNSPAQPAPLSPYLKANYPEIAETVRLFSASPLLVKYGDRAFYESGFVLADASVFDVFTIPFVAGDRASAFAEPNTVVLTEDAAKKYFGNENPLGRTLNVENQFLVRVTGVVRNPPQNSDIRFGVLGEFRIVGNFRKGYETHWGNHEYFTYARLTPGVEAGTVIRKIARIVLDHDPSLPKSLTMTPLVRIHLYEDGAIKSVAIFVLVAAFILIIAAFNFINLTTARSGRRTKEIAVRKVSGAVRHQLIKQFLSESIFLSLGSFFLALAAVALVLPSFDAVIGKNFALADLFKPGLFLFLLGTAVVTGIFSGAYPAFLLSSLRPVGLLKGGGSRTGSSSGGARFRKILVAAQFAISTVLIISALLIHKQLVFVRNYDLGIRKENIVVLPAKKPILNNRETFIGRLTGQAGITNATFVSSPPSGVENYASGFEWEGMDKSIKPGWAFVATDERFLDTLGLTLVAGRNFPEKKAVQEVPYFIVNQRAVEEMRVKNPVGTRFSLWGWSGSVLGVVKDFHFRSLRDEIRPLLLFVMPQVYRLVLVKIRPGKDALPEILARIKGVWDEFAPGMPFSYEFLDADYDRKYQSEEKMGKEFRYFSFLGILISCLGLIGLAAYIAQQKRREIGIRKVLGATVPNIMGQIGREFFVPILLSNLIAWPAAFWAMNTWLQSFAYRTSLSIGIFLIAAVSVLVLGLATVSFQAIKAALANPTDSLRFE